MPRQLLTAVNSNFELLASTSDNYPGKLALPVKPVTVCQLQILDVKLVS